MAQPSTPRICIRLAYDRWPRLSLLLRTSLFLLWSGVFHAVQAQSVAPNGSYVESRNDLAPLPPSPKVAKLGEFGNIPVNYYTGLPDVKIPLYTYQHNGLTVPIYLAYHSTGLLVDAQASEVGLGWSLRAGGVIGRTIYGYSDLNPGGYATGRSIPSLKHPQKMYDFYRETAQFHTRDSEPDVYNFTFGSESGRFVLDSTATPARYPSRTCASCASTTNATSSRTSKACNTGLAA